MQKITSLYNLSNLRKLAPKFNYSTVLLIYKGTGTLYKRNYQYEYRKYNYTIVKYCSVYGYITKLFFSLKLNFPYNYKGIK